MLLLPLGTDPNSFTEVFETLNIADQADLKKSVQYFREMTGGLIDAHFQLEFKVPLISNEVLPPWPRQLLWPFMRCRAAKL